jgi:hypothetical protein
MYFDAMVSTASSMYRERKNTDKMGRCARAYLDFVDEESTLQVALMADAGDEHSILLRIHNSEGFDLVSSSRQTVEFLQRIRVLFMQETCWACGYTAHALRVLSRPRFLFVDGVPKSVGGPRAVTATVKKRCLDRMKQWVFLAQLTVKSEFPWAELMHAFSVFDLAPLAGTRLAPCDLDARANESALLHRFAAVLNLDADQLCDEFAKHRPIAVRFFRESRLTNFEAWRKTIETTQRPGLRASSQALRAGALVQVLMRYGGWGGSTSGVERLFARQAAHAPPNRAPCGEALIDDDLALLSSDPADDADAVKVARQLWARFFGCVRTVPHNRRDLGIPRGPRAGRTEREFIRQRRLEVGKLLRQSSLNGIPDAPEPAMTPSHTKEAAFQTLKFHKRVLRALEDGSLPYQEIPDELIDALNETLDQEKAGGDARYFAEQARKRAARDKPVRPDLRGIGVFIDESIQAGERGQLMIAIRKGGMWLCSDRVRAGVFVVPDVTEPGQRNSICAVLSGALVATPPYITSCGERGPSLHYEAAIRKRRFVWCSPEFIARHSAVYDIISARMRMRDSNWKTLPNKARVLAKAGTTDASRVLIFVLPAEQRSEDTRKHASVRHALFALPSVDDRWMCGSPA